MCGENVLSNLVEFHFSGSPPRVRGKLLQLTQAMGSGGITPACAGKTSAIASVLFELEDHPRVCGENQTPSTLTPARIGSPPRVRGKQMTGFQNGYKGRITPACAGKTLKPIHSFVEYQDHPRVCGENLLRLLGSRVHQGSPPRVRGKRTGAARWTKRPRITPACAGKT